MSDLSSAEFLNYLLEILPSLREVIQASRQTGLASEIKADGSWVTLADRATEKKL